MVRHARNKKRRAGRIGRTKLKNRNYAKFKPPQIQDGVVKAKWDPAKSAAFNMQNLGLSSRPNSDVASRGIQVLPSEANNAVELFDIPESDVIPKKTKSLSMLPMSVDDQKFMERCFKKHGTNYERMARDIKTNDMQYTEHKLRKIGARFLLLNPHQLRVEVPENVKHLMAS